MYNYQEHTDGKAITGNKNLSPSTSFKTRENKPPQYLLLRMWDKDVYNTKFVKISDDPEKVELGVTDYYFVHADIFGAGDGASVYQKIQDDLEAQKSNLQADPDGFYTVRDKKIANGAKAVLHKRVESLEEMKKTNPRDYQSANNPGAVSGKNMLESLNIRQSKAGGGNSRVSEVQVKGPPRTLSPNYISGKSSVDTRGLDMTAEEIEKMNVDIEDILRYAKNYDLDITLLGHTDLVGKVGSREEETGNFGLSIRRARGMRAHMMSEQFGDLALDSDDFASVSGDGETKAQDYYNQEKKRLTKSLVTNANTKDENELKYLKSVLDYKKVRQKINEKYSPVRKAEIERARKEIPAEILNLRRKLSLKHLERLLVEGSKLSDEKRPQIQKLVEHIKKLNEINAPFKKEMVPYDKTYTSKVPEVLRKEYSSKSTEDVKSRITELESKGVNNTDVEQHPDLVKLREPYRPFRKIDVGFERKYEYIR